MSNASRWLMYALIAASLAGLTAAGLRPTKQAAGAAPLPPDIAMLIDRASEALGSGDIPALEALADRPGRLAWLGGKAAAARIGWKVAGSELPAVQGNAGKGYVADFYAYHTCESIGDHFHRLVQDGSGWRIGPELMETDTLGYRVHDHDLKVTFDIPAATCAVTDEAQIERTTAQVGGLCILRLTSDLHVDSAAIGGQPVTVSTAPGMIVFAGPDARQFTLSLAYHGSYPKGPGVDNYILPTETVMNSYWWPHIARLPATTTVTATVQHGWTAEAQGDPQGAQTPGETTVFRDRNELPNCYFSLDTGPYVITSRMVDGRRLSAYQLKPNKGLANRALDRLANALEFFVKSFGPFPYDHYEMVASNGPFGGALEAYSFATFQGGDFGSNVHELSHTWWGGIVPNTYLHSMWNEAFANYSDELFTRMTAATKPPAALRGQHRAPRFGRNLLTLYPVPVGRAFDTGSNVENASGYGKGAIVMDMLEDDLGTETMIRAMRQFRDDHKPGEAAEWANFERAVRETTGKDYGWFFRQWLDRAGVPVVKLTGLVAAPRGSRYAVTGRIEQTGNPYQLTLPLVVTAANGSVERTVVHLSGPSAEFTVSTAGAPKTVAVDPDGTVLMAGAPTPEGVDPFTWTAQ